MFYTPKQIKAVFGHDRKTLRNWRKAGKIEFIKTAGGHYKYLVADDPAIRAALDKIPLRSRPAVNK